MNLFYRPHFKCEKLVQMTMEEANGQWNPKAKGH